MAEDLETTDVQARRQLDTPSIPDPTSQFTDGKHEREVVAEFSYSHSGWLPHPYTLQAYKDIDPELVTAIVTAAKEEAKHRQAMERMVKQAGARRSTWGLAWGGLLGLAAIGSATYLGLHGVKEVAVAVVGLPMLGFLGSFIVGSNNNKTERIEKERIRRSQIGADASEQIEGEDA